MKAPAWLVPVLVVLCAVAGVIGSRLAMAPSLVEVFAEASPNAEPRRSVFVVRGVRCVDTAEMAARQLAGIDGVQRLEAFASRARLDVTYDPARVDAAALREAFEGPVHDANSGEYLFDLFEVIEMDGVKIESGREPESP
ncbi:MAG: hypothetical protein IPK64_02870 [bacterium]|nr:hypothetical protein [bacterium]